MNRYLTRCTDCGHNTSTKYAREHGGRCKSCVDPETVRSAPSRNERIIDHGYQAYAREEGHYDFGGDQ